MEVKKEHGEEENVYFGFALLDFFIIWFYFRTS